MLLRVIPVALALLSPAAIAQEPPGGLTLSSSVTSGWTSNAEGAAGGRSDGFLKHGHDLGFAIAGEGFALRGALALSETRYSRLWQENDHQAGGDVAGEFRLSPETLIRATLALALHEEGQLLATGAGPVGATTPYLKGNAGLEIETHFAGARLVAGLGYGTLIHGDTGFYGAFLPVRTRADSGVLSGDLRLSYALSQNLLLTGQMRGLVQIVSEADQADFGRVPARALRVAAGIESAIPLRAAFSLETGADIVWADAGGIGMSVLPYARGEMTLALGGGFDLRTQLRTSLDFETPPDSYADWLIEGRAGIGFAMTQTMRLEAAVFASAARSVGLDIEHKRRIGGEVSAETAFGEALSGRAAVSHSQTSGLAPGFEETRVTLTLAATL